jgi:hypothetical protein
LEVQVTVLIELYEPPMCCPTGVCGPSVDETMIHLMEDIEKIKNKYPAAKVERYMLTTHPQKFKENQAVYQLVSDMGKNALPITTLNGSIIKSQSYPTLAEIENHIKD